MRQKFDFEIAQKTIFLLLMMIFLLSGNLAAQNQNTQAASRDALVLYNNGEYAAAIAVCEEEIKADPERIDAYVVMCWSLIANKQYAEAKQRAEDGMKFSPQNLRLSEALGEACYYLGQNPQAIENFQRFVANAPESNQRLGLAYYLMGEIFIRQARYQHADISLTVAVKNRPWQDTWWARLGYARERAGNYYEALNAYDEALQLNPASTDAGNGKARVSSQMR